MGKIIRDIIDIIDKVGALLWPPAPRPVPVPVPVRMRGVYQFLGVDGAPTDDDQGDRWRPSVPSDSAPFPTPLEST